MDGSYIGSGVPVVPNNLPNGDTMKTRHCDECKHCDMRPLAGMVCEKGHKPRFYMPRDSYPYSNGWGWKRKCFDYDEGKPKSIEERHVSI